MSPLSLLRRCALPRGRLARLVLVLLAPAAVVAQTPPPLSLDEALRIAQQRSQGLPAQDAAAAASRERAVAAGQLPDPSFRAALSNWPVDGPERFSLTRDFMTMRSMALMQEFTRGDKRVARSARFEREAEMALAARDAALTRLQTDTALAWIELHFRQRMQLLMQAQRAEAVLQVDSADAVHRGGGGTQADVFAARSALAQVDDSLRQLAREVATARTRLARWVGAGAERGVGSAPDWTQLALPATEIEARLEQQPRLALLERQVALAQAEVEVAQRERRADWSVELMFSQRGSAYSNMVSVNVAVPLQWDRGNRQDREIAAQLARVEQARAEREEALREARSQLHSTLQQWQLQHERLAHYDSTLIPLAAQREQAVLAAYRGGSTALSSVLEARRAQIDARLMRLQIEQLAAAAWAELNHLMPRALPHSKGQ